MVVQMVILEGPDDGGKSTLAGRLSTDLGMAIAPRLSSSLGGPVESLAAATDARIDEQRSVDPMLHDRFSLISEVIYGPICRGEVKDAFNTRWYLGAWNRMMELDPIIIFCIPTTLPEVNPEEQMEGVAGNAQAIYDQYMAWYLHMVWTYQKLNQPERIFRWDFQDPATEGIYLNLKQSIERNI